MKVPDMDKFLHRGIRGAVKYSEPDKVWHGKLIVRPGQIVTFEAETLDLLVPAFRESVDDYLTEIK